MSASNRGLSLPGELHRQRGRAGEETYDDDAADDHERPAVYALFLLIEAGDLKLFAVTCRPRGWVGACLNRRLLGVGRAARRRLGCFLDRHQLGLCLVYRPCCALCSRLGPGLARHRDLDIGHRVACQLLPAAVADDDGDFRRGQGVHFGAGVASANDAERRDPVTLGRPHASGGAMHRRIRTVSRGTLPHRCHRIRRCGRGHSDQQRQHGRDCRENPVVQPNDAGKPTHLPEARSEEHSGVAQFGLPSDLVTRVPDPDGEFWRPQRDRPRVDRAVAREGRVAG